MVLTWLKNKLMNYKQKIQSINQLISQNNGYWSAWILFLIACRIYIYILYFYVIVSVKVISWVMSYMTKNVLKIQLTCMSREPYHFWRAVKHELSIVSPWYFHIPSKYSSPMSSNRRKHLSIAFLYSDGDRAMGSEITASDRPWVFRYTSIGSGSSAVPV